MRKLTENEFIKRVMAIHGKAYTYISGFINTNTKVKMYCNRCHKEFEIKPAKLFIGQGCKHCRAERISETNRFSEQEFRDRIFAVLGKDYEILSSYSDYHDQNSQIVLKHLSCGNIYTTRLYNIINKNRTCPYCTRERIKHSGFKYTQEEFEQQVKDLVWNEYTILSEYINSKTKVKFRHNTCGEEFWMQPQKFIKGAERCPACYHSRGEDMVKYFLKKQTKYKIIEQYKFKDLFYKSEKAPLRFDFALLFNDKLCYLIEYDGIQHFKLGHWNTEEKFIETKERDLLKDKYCIEHKITLIRIPYTEFNNIEQILKKEIIE